MALDLTGGQEFRSALLGQHLFTLTFDTNGTSAPDGVNPSSADAAVARSGVGTYTVTFPAAMTAQRLDYAAAGIIGNEPSLKAKVVSYTAGVLTLQVSQLVLPVSASGLITCTTFANYADTDYMTIGDGLAPAKLYEFDTAGDGVTAGRVQVDISGATTAADVAAILRTAIRTNQPAIAVTNNGDGTLTVIQQIPGTVGNVTMTENVANAAHTVSGFSGGAAATNAVADTTDKKVAVVCVFSRRSQ